MSEIPIQDIEILLDRTEWLWDEGPDNEGWQSNELREARYAVEEWLDRLKKQEKK